MGATGWATALKVVASYFRQAQHNAQQGTQGAGIEHVGEPEAFALTEGHFSVWFFLGVHALGFNSSLVSGLCGIGAGQLVMYAGRRLGLHPQQGQPQAGAGQVGWQQLPRGWRNLMVQAAWAVGLVAVVALKRNMRHS